MGWNFHEKASWSCKNACSWSCSSLAQPSVDPGLKMKIARCRTHLPGAALLQRPAATLQAVRDVKRHLHAKKVGFRSREL